MDLRFLTFGGLFLCCCMVCAWCVHGVCVCADACGLHGCVCGCLFLLHVWCVICKHVYSMCRFHCIASVCCYVFLSCFSQGVRHTCMTLNKKIRRCRKVDEWVCVCGVWVCVRCMLACLPACLFYVHVVYSMCVWVCNSIKTYRFMSQ